MVANVERTQIYLTEEEQRALEARAFATGRTKSDLIREAIDAYLDLGEVHEETMRRWREAVRAAAGIAPYLPETYVEDLRAVDREHQRELERRWRG